MMSAKYFEYYTIILRGGRFFVDTLYIHFWGLLHRKRILRGEKFSLRPSFAFSCSPILASLLYATRAVGVSKTLQHGIFTRQGSRPVRHWAVELSSLFFFANQVS